MSHLIEVSTNVQIYDAKSQIVSDPATLELLDGYVLDDEKQLKRIVKQFKLSGGRTRFQFNKQHDGLLLVTDFSGPRRLTKSEMSELLEECDSEWCRFYFDELIERLRKAANLQLSAICFDQKQTVRHSSGEALVVNSTIKDQQAALRKKWTQYAKGNAPKGDGSSHLQAFKSIEKGDLKKLEQLLPSITSMLDQVCQSPKDDFHSETLLTYAARHESEKIVQLLLKGGADPNVPNSFSFSHYPLHCATNYKVVDALLKAGVKPNQANSSKFTALLCEAVLKDPKSVALLLKAGANPDARALYTEVDQPLKRAIVCNLKSAKLLLDAGAKDRQGALLHLCKQGNLVPDRLQGIKLLTRYGASFTGEMILELISHGDYYTLLHALKQRQAPLDAVYKFRGEQTSPVQYCASNGMSGILKDVLKAGASPDFGSGKKVPVIIAVTNGNDSVLKVLVEAGANVDVKVGGKSLIEYARAQGSENIAEILASSLKKRKAR